MTLSFSRRAACRGVSFSLRGVRAAAWSTTPTDGSSAWPRSATRARSCAWPTCSRTANMGGATYATRIEARAVPVLWSGGRVDRAFARSRCSCRRVDPLRNVRQLRRTRSDDEPRRLFLPHARGRSRGVESKEGREMTPERLRYAGRGQIVRERDGRLVSPRDVVKWFNELLDGKSETSKKGAEE